MPIGKSGFAMKHNPENPYVFDITRTRGWTTRSLAITPENSLHRREWYDRINGLKWIRTRVFGMDLGRTPTFIRVEIELETGEWTFVWHGMFDELPEKADEEFLTILSDLRGGKVVRKRLNF